MEGPLTHFQYDTFKTNPSLKWVEPAYVTFSIGADGKVEGGDQGALAGPLGEVGADHRR